MPDDLQQLLKRADAGALAPEIDAIALPHRVRRTARNQRRLAACGFAVIALLALSPLGFMHQASQKNHGFEIADFRTLNAQAELHERTIAIMESRVRRPARAIDPTDRFFAKVQFERDRAALVLLNDAARKLQNDDPLAAATVLRRTVQLFPETPAAAQASRRLDQIDPVKRQS